MLYQMQVIVFTHGLSISDIEIGDNCFSDHKPVLFTPAIPGRPASTALQTRWTCNFTASAVDEFASVYTSSQFSDLHLMDSSSETQNADAYLCCFNDTCLNILNSIAPLKAKHPKKRSEPWLNDSIRSLRQTCRRYERKWRKDRLQVSYELLRVSLSAFQKAIKSDKSKYLSEIITKNDHCHKILFSTIDSVLNPVVNVFSDASAGPDLCIGILGTCLCSLVQGGGSPNTMKREI